MSDTPSSLAFDFIATPNSKLRSIYGLAGIWDSGQLTSHPVVMKTSIFYQWFGREMEPYTGDRVNGAVGEALKPRGVATMRLAISGLTTLSPELVSILVCDNLDPDFLIGRKLLTNWEVSVHYRNKQETWQAGDQFVEAMSQREAKVYNEGLNLGERPPPERWAQTREWFNDHRNMGTCYGWTAVSRGKKGGKPKTPPGKTKTRGKNRPPPSNSPCAGGPKRERRRHNHPRTRRSR